MVKTNGEFKEVKISTRAINVLLKLNNEKRNDVSADRTFIKSLLIAVCSIKAIQQNIRIEDGIMEFMNGNFLFSLMFLMKSIIYGIYDADLFIIRVSGDDADGSRLAAYEVLINRSCDEIRQNNFT